MLTTGPGKGRGNYTDIFCPGVLENDIFELFMMIYPGRSEINLQWIQKCSSSNRSEWMFRNINSDCGRNNRGQSSDSVFHQQGYEFI